MMERTTDKQPDGTGLVVPSTLHILSTPQSTRKALEWALVLEALSIPWQLEHGSEDRSLWEIIVPDAYIDKAQKQIALYEKENHGWPPPAPTLPDNIQTSGWSAVWAGTLLAAFYLWLGPYRAESEILTRAACTPQLLDQGQWWRVFSAIGVHGDFVHLFSNLCVIVPVGAAAVMLLGGGVTWSLALFSGALANLTYLLLFHSPGTSFGASTAAFGLLGLLGGKRLAALSGKNRVPSNAGGFPPRTPRNPLATKKAFIILGAIVAVFALLGSAPHSNVAGHFFGLFYGLLMGAGVHFATRRSPPPNWLQRVLELLALSIFMLSWRLAAGQG